MALVMIAVSALLGAVFVLALLLIRLRAVINPNRPRPHRNVQLPTHLMIVLGSGGHTAEMIAMLERAVNEKDLQARLNWSRFSHRTWVVSSGDALSAQRAKQFEDMVGGEPATYDVKVVPRAREIHQPLYTAPLSCLRCMAACAGVLQSGKHSFPSVILCNGPATATIMVFTSIILRFLDVRGCNNQGKMRTIYIESFARVKRLSLSGKLLSRIVDRFLVQWPQLQRAGGRAEYVGVLV